MTALEVATAAGTVGAAVVAAVSVVITGRQGQEQQRLLVGAQDRDRLERRADFELGLLMQLSSLSRSTFVWNTAVERDDQREVRALLLALPPDLLSTLRDLVAPRDDALAGERRRARWAREKEGEQMLTQRLIDRELRDAIFARSDIALTGREQWVSIRRWRRLVQRLRQAKAQVRGLERPAQEP